MIKQYLPEYRQFNSIESCVDESFYKQKTLEPFSSILLDFVDKLSKNLLRDKNIREYPELVAFAFWIRRKSLEEKLNLIKLDSSLIQVARGVAFHIAPSNVDIMFLYSWILSLLAGNINIVRISEVKSQLVFLVIENLMTLFNDKKYESISTRNKIVNYEKDEEINKYLSIISDLRILWGGNETVKYFKMLPTQAHCKDISFSDKFSFSIINSEVFLASELDEKNNLVISFYNDGFFFDQKACSSPQIIFFVGPIDISKKAAKQFKLHLDGIIKEKSYEKQTASLMDQLNYWYEYATNFIQENFKEFSKTKSTFIETTIDGALNYNTCGAGIFLIIYIEKLTDIQDFSSRNHQTVGYYGFKREELIELVRKKGADAPLRLVKIGSALNFNVIWDGMSLITEFTKIIEL